jgi:hypothetical protein
MPLDPRYITDLSLEQYFVDKDTGEPLAFGTVEFWQDDNRVVPKLVFELTGAPPNYTYTALPNPITLSAVGTISDINGNNVALYYYPFDALGNIQLYYVVIRNSLGVIQFTREAWPNTTSGANPAATDVGLSNELSNPQFVDVSFLPNNPDILAFVGAATTTVPIAPRWDLVVQHTNNTTVTVTRTAVAGISAYPGNPPYTLTILPGLNIAALTLRQRLDNNPDVFARAVGGQNGYLATSILLAPLTTLSISYQPNGQPAQVLLNANNVGGVYAEFTNTVQLLPANNPSTADTGYVDILLNLPIVGASTFSNVQIVGLNSNLQGVTYDQVTSNREKDQLFNYYNPLLQAKPIPSYLVGWDFPFNPTQFLGPTLAASAAGVNTSRYVWDQTIVFQSANNGPAISRSAAGNGALRITATNATQFALIQYLPQAMARKILNNRLSVNVSALTPFAGGLTGTISLWSTVDGALPSTTGNASIIATIDANGKPATFNGNWVEVPRSGLGNAQFVVGNSATTNFNNYGFSGWTLNGAGQTNTATFFAIVVGFAQLGAAGTIDFNSISLVPGDIPTEPAPKLDSEIILDCVRYYQKTFAPATIPAQNVGVGTGESTWVGANMGAFDQRSASILFTIPMNSIPAITFFNPAAANGQVRDETVNLDCSATTAVNISSREFSVLCTGNAGTNIADFMGVHWTADSRLGL